MFAVQKITFELSRTYFVEFTTQMNKNTALLFLFAVLAFLLSLFFSLNLIVIVVAIFRRFFRCCAH